MAEAPAFWRERGWRAWLLWPWSLLFALLAGVRRRWLRPQQLPVPVIVVGNIAVGGSGKTPVVHWLVAALKAAGWQPGVISRGHGGAVSGVAEVPANADAAHFGDEPVLLKQLCGCPLVVGRDRVAAGRELLRLHPECDVIISDDGLQHYRLGRDIELVVVDPATLGNRLLLPAGPLREPVRRLAQADVIIAHGEFDTGDTGLNKATAGRPRFAMRLQGDTLQALADPQRQRPLAELRAQRVHAVAGIGQPQRFFAQLAAAGLEVIPHPFADHHRFRAQDLDFNPPAPILMTAKDAVKCHAFAPADSWVLPVVAQLDEAAAACIVEKLLNGRPPA